MLVFVYCFKWIKIKLNNKDCLVFVLKFFILNLLRSGVINIYMLIYVYVFGFIMNRSKILKG